jgi:hypothetical protein
MLVASVTPTTTSRHAPAKAAVVIFLLMAIAKEKAGETLSERRGWQD